MSDEIDNVVELKPARRGKAKRPSMLGAPDYSPPPEFDGRGLPAIPIVAGRASDAVDQAVQVLADSDARVFQRSGSLWRPVRVGRAAATLKLGKTDGVTRPEGATMLAPIDEAALADIIGRRIGFFKYDARAQDWLPRDCPGPLAATIIAQRGHGWPMPRLKAIVQAPTLCPDGTVLNKVGYDASSQILFESDTIWPKIPERPKLADAELALRKLANFLQTMPFVGDTDQSAALSMLLTVLIRPVLAAAPLFAITAPAAGTGKSLLADLAAILATGHPAPAIAGDYDAVELEKRLGAALIAGDAIVSLDNVAAPLRSSFLCSLLTQEAVSVRQLGASRNLTLSTSALMTVNGNNLVIGGDLARRTCLIRLDAGLERPETRTFSSDLRVVALKRRAELVTAGLTALRAFALTDDRVPKPSGVGSFEDWSRVVRGTLMWCGFADAWGNADLLRADDPQRERVAGILHALKPFGQFTAAKVATEALDDVRLREQLAQFIDRSGKFDTHAFGLWLRKNRDRIIDGLKASQLHKVKDVSTWIVDEHESKERG